MALRDQLNCLRSDLYNFVMQDGQAMNVTGYSASGDIPAAELWYYDGSSTAIDNGTSVIKPNAILSTDPGRYVIYMQESLWTSIKSRPSLATVATSGSYLDLTNRPSNKKQETSSGTTNSSGNYTFTFSNSYAIAPNIQANIIGGTNTNLIKITSVSTTSCTVNVVNRTDVVGLLPSYSNVNGASVDILVTEK